MALAVEHVTTYRYRKPVRFGEHRLMFRPREGHDVQVLEASLDVNADFAGMDVKVAISRV